ncbi:MAG: hypothetical protein IT440_04985, partial [Phycisphaeraceae bacterium]|nr:hypothetical protein [Phycisphaeraceae bacterium]
VAEAVKDAANQLRPVELAVGCGSALFNVNRRPPLGQTGIVPNVSGVVDHRVRILTLWDARNHVAAVLFHFGCHPTTIDSGRRVLTSEYAGLAREWIERHLGVPALFLPGCFGNVRPRIVDEHDQPRRAEVEDMQRNGERLGRAVVNVVENLQPGDQRRHQTRLAASARQVELPFGPGYGDDELRRLADDQSTPASSLYMRHWASQLLEQRRTRSAPTHWPLELQIMRVGNIVLPAIGGEPVLEIGIGLERAYERILPDAETWSMGYANGMVGYLCTEQQKQEGGFEPNAWSGSWLPGPFVNEQDIIARNLCDMAGGLPA